MVYSTEQKTFMTESYFHNGCKIKGEWFVTYPKWYIIRENFSKHSGLDFLDADKNGES
jgi:hypothetical protein